MIQGGARGFLQRRKFHDTRHKIILIQRAYREIQALRYGKRLQIAKKKATQKQWAQQKRLMSPRRLGSDLISFVE